MSDSSDDDEEEKKDEDVLDKPIYVKKPGSTTGDMLDASLDSEGNSEGDTEGFRSMDGYPSLKPKSALD